MHYEDLWVSCEKFHQENNKEDKVSSILEELVMKVNLYRALDAKEDLSQDDRSKIKSRTMGEILLTLTRLSLIDNIDVFQALSTALQYRSVDVYSQKY